MKRQLALSFFAITGTIAGIAITNSSAPITADMSEALPAGDVSQLAHCVESDFVSTIFAPGTDPKVVERVSRAIENLNAGQRFQPGNRWPGADNTPVTITYSFPADGINIPNGVGEGAGPNNLNSTLTGQFGSSSTWKNKFAQIFQAWEDITGNVYIEVSDDGAAMGSSGPLHGGSGRGDIRITGKSIDGNFGILAYNSFPGSGSGGDMVIDTDEFWANSSQDFRFFRNTLSHEHGHGMGLFHVCPITQTKLMEPFLTTAFDGPQHDDIRGATHHYGDFYEPNNNAASAGFLASLTGPGSFPFVLDDMALRDDADEDFYSFTIDGAGSVDVEVRIVGAVYENNPQDQACAPTGSTFDSTARIDPDLAVLDTDGVTVLASVDANGLSGNESLTGVVLPAAGTYFMRVRPVNSPGVAQIYDLAGTVTIDAIMSVDCIADLNDDDIVDTADLGILIGVFGTNSPLADLNDDNIVDTADLGILIGVFGTCTE